MSGDLRPTSAAPAMLGLCRTRWRMIFGVYAIVLLALTHWPRLEMPLIQIRSDLVVHMTAFGLWTCLLAMCAWFGAPLSRRNILISAPIALVYSAIDEVTQGIPGINRTVALDDGVANGLGVLVGTGILFWASGRLANRLSDTRDEPGAEPMTKE
jgi:VanZ family protein